MVLVEGWLQAIPGRVKLDQMLLETRFMPSQEGTMYKALLALWQDGSILDYQRQFEMMVVPLMGFQSRFLKEVM